MQNKLIIRTIIILLCLNSNACGIIRPYVADKAQGNVISKEKVDQLKIGMTKAQVQYLMGVPILEESFDPNRWDYVYTLKPANSQMQKKRLTVYFIGNKLVRMDGTYQSESLESINPTPLLKNEKVKNE